LWASKGRISTTTSDPGRSLICPDAGKRRVTGEN
jgi:hypothetical protein